MKQKDFIDQHQAEWDEIEQYLDTPSKANTERIPELYRRLCRHYSLAKSRSYSSVLINHLSSLVFAVHQKFYAKNSLRRFNPMHFFAQGFPDAVRRQWRWVVLATALFYLPLIGIIIAIQYHPDLVYTLLDGETVKQMESMYQPGEGDVDNIRDAESDITMFGFYIYNNTSIGFRNYASGMLFGVGTLVIILFNSLHIGAAAGHLTHVGYGSTFWPFVAGHSAFELTAITISAAGGLKLGISLLIPGQLSRKQSLINAAKETLPLVTGAAAMFFMAAFVEAFWSSRVEIAVSIKYIVGASLWLITIGYFVFMGRTNNES